MKNRAVPKKKKKMALYEVLSRGLSNSKRNKDLESLRPTENKRPGSSFSGTGSIAAKNLVKKPRMFQVNRGRVEITMPNQLAIAILMLLAVMVLAAYRIAQRQALKENEVPVAGSVEENTVQQGQTEQDVIASSLTNEEKKEKTEPAAVEQGSNWIVLASHKSKEQLVPVQAYFDGNGIEAQIRQKGKRFFLHTKQTYNDPGKTGTDGWNMKQKIIKIGASYEPPTGYGKFDFRTVYGMKSFE